MGDPAGFAAMKERMRSTWMAGDFGRIAQYNITTAEEFINRLNISAGMKVLDVACGTGNTSTPAARKGAHMTGVNIATNLLEQARQRSHTKAVTASFEEGDAEELAYAEAQHDFVIAMFGAMFAPRYS